MRRILWLPIVAATFIGAINAQEASPKGSASAASPASIEQIKQEVLKVEDQRNDAILKGDIATLDRMFADELAWTNPYGELLTKAQVLANLKSGTQHFSNIRHSDSRVHVYGDTVVMTVHTVSNETYKGKNFENPRTYTNVFVRQNGEWKLVVHQATSIGKPQP